MEGKGRLDFVNRVMPSHYTIIEQIDNFSQGYYRVKYNDNSCIPKNCMGEFLA